MSPQERRVTATLLTQIIAFAVYTFYMSGYYADGLLDGPGGFTLIGRSVFALIAGTIVLTIVVQIVLAIATAIVTREKEQETLTDERDRLIEIRSMKVSHIGFSILFVITMGLLALNLMLPPAVLMMIIAAMFLSSVLGELVKLFLYRRGA